jgi:hypothetical protein
MVYFSPMVSCRLKSFVISPSAMTAEAVKSGAFLPTNVLISDDPLQAK